jgi:hypothetical protein
MTEGRPVVLLPLAEYRTLLEQNVLAPKQGKYNPLSAKQKRKVQDKVDAACVVVMVSIAVCRVVVVYKHTCHRFGIVFAASCVRDFPTPSVQV